MTGQSKSISPALSVFCCRHAVGDEAYDDFIEVTRQFRFPVVGIAAQFDPIIPLPFVDYVGASPQGSLIVSFILIEELAEFLALDADFL